MKTEIIQMNSRRGMLRASFDAIVPFFTIALALVGVHFWPVLAIPAAVFIGTRYRHINNLIHWASHSSLCSNSKFNRFLGKILCVSILFDFASYCIEHLTHHRYIGDYTRDDDFKNVKDFLIGKSLSLRTRLATIFRTRLFSAYTPKIGFKTKSQTIGVLFYFSIITWLFFVSPITSITLIVAMFVIYPLIRHLTDLVDHGGLYENKNHVYQSRNFIIKNKIIRWFFFPTNDCFHKVHHDYPFLSPWVQEDVHQYLMDTDPEYASIQHSWIDHVDGLLAQKPIRSLLLN
jgi:fatty acid desaturase